MSSRLLESAVRREINSLDPSLPFADVRTMEDVVGPPFRRPDSLDYWMMGSPASRVSFPLSVPRVDPIVALKAE